MKLKNDYNLNKIFEQKKLTPAWVDVCLALGYRDRAGMMKWLDRQPYEIVIDKPASYKLVKKE